MTRGDADPWTRWYAAYRADRAAFHLARHRCRTANVMAGLLLAYMLFGGLAASVVVGVVLAH